MPKLKPSAREKKRYLVLLDKKEKIDKILRENLGIGYVRARPFFIEAGKKNEVDYAIVCINNKSLNDVKSALANAKINCIGISGTIKKARSKFLPKIRK